MTELSQATGLPSDLLEQSEGGNSLFHLRFQVALAAASLLLALVLLAVLPAVGSNRQFFAIACHQQADRCYSIAGHPAALCVRCVWLYFGLAVGHLVFAWAPLREKGALRLLFWAATLLLADVALEAVGCYHNLPPVRALTGFCFGSACAWFTLRGLTELVLKFKSKNTQP